MPTRFQKKRAQRKRYFIDHKEKLSLQASKNYAANSVFKKCASKEYCETHKEQRVAYNRKYYEAHKEKRKACFNDCYTPIQK